ncbi:hypothetical protein WA026_018376 [Henosepilachna vigintioctopunctata]|uniref:Uncharacterized protein n=1 Tax=Henosepilachna vigintioctopunctata TaxID=420089 RepID=A0AAW1V9Y1_9CUCU
MESKYSILILFFSAVNSAKILGWFTCPSISHQGVFQPIWKELSLRGHEVTVITSDPLKVPILNNLTEIDMKFTYALWKDIDISNMRREVMSSFEIQYNFQRVHERALEMAFKVKEIQEVMRKPKHYFDLILVESHHPIIYGLQHKFGAPLISISSLGNYNFLHFLSGNSIHPYLYKDFVSDLFGELTMWEKFDSIYLVVGSYILNKFIIYPHADKIARSYFGDDMPYIEEMVKNTSLWFENVNPIFADRKPLAPNYMQFSHSKPIDRTPLPKVCFPNFLEHIFFKLNIGSSITDWFICG